MNKVEILTQTTLASETNDFKGIIDHKLQEIQHDYKKRGLYTSGPYPEAIRKCIDDELSGFYSRLFDKIEMTQADLNIKYNDKDVTNIQKMVLAHSRVLIDDLLIEYYQKPVLQIFNQEMFANTKIQICMNIDAVIENKVESIKVKSKIKKDEPAVRQAKVANWIAVISFLIAIASLTVSIIALNKQP